MQTATNYHRQRLRKHHILGMASQIRDNCMTEACGCFEHCLSFGPLKSKLRASKQLAAFIFFLTTHSIYMQNLCIYKHSTIYMIQKVN